MALNDLQGLSNSHVKGRLATGIKDMIPHVTRKLTRVIANKGCLSGPYAKGQVEGLNSRQYKKIWPLC